MAYLPQHLPSAASLTVSELVAFGRYPWHGLLGRLSKNDKAQIERAMALTDTAEFADRMVDTLSGGERQRVWLAMLLAQGTPGELMDDATLEAIYGIRMRVMPHPTDHHPIAVVQ